MSFDNVEPMAPPSDARPGLSLISARSLQTRTFPEIRWLIDDVLPEGLTLFCGRPKLGKSWATLDIALAIAEGGQWLGKSADQGPVLTLALEDNLRRLQSRMRKIRPDGEWPDAAEFATACPRLNNGGTDAIERWLDQNPAGRMVTVDTLATVKPLGGSGSSDYQADYAALRGLHRIANDRGVAVVVVHHVRKAGAESGDMFDTVSGSTGLTGAADTTLILTKRQIEGEASGTVLYGRGRDIQEFEHGVEFDVDRCRWKMLGDADRCFLSDTRKRIIAAFATGAETPALISDRAGIDIEVTKKTLQRMVNDGQANRVARGQYRDAISPRDTPSMSQASRMSRTTPERDSRDVRDSIQVPKPTTDTKPTPNDWRDFQ